jgi:hypothetical protein
MCAKFWPENMKERDNGRPGHKWEDSIKMFLKEMRWESGLDLS